MKSWQTWRGVAFATVLLSGGVLLGGCAGGTGGAGGGGGGASGGSRVDPMVAAARADSAPIKGTSAVLTVFGMSCPLCATNVDRELSSVAGVKGVRVDMQTGEATVEFAPELAPSRAALVRAVDHSGFTVTKIQVK